MEFESAIATADDLESTGEVEPLAIWEHEDLAQVQFQGSIELPKSTEKHRNTEKHRINEKHQFANTRFWK